LAQICIKSFFGTSLRELTALPDLLTVLGRGIGSQKKEKGGKGNEKGEGCGR